VEEEKADEEAASLAAQTTKDEIARLIRLFKHPDAQVYWSNHYGVHEQFQPQNLMVAYVNDPGTEKPAKKNPWEPSSEEWEELAIQTYDIEPTNITRRNIYRDASWMKSTWNDMRKYFFQVFTQYDRSGQCSGVIGEWCSSEEQQRWLRAAFWNDGATNTIARFPTVMIYSIAVLEEGDFQGIG